MSLNRVALLLAQRDDCWNRESWFAPLSLALEGVSSKEAAWQPPGDGNTIWQTVTHINFWNDRILQKITGRPSTKPQITNDATFGGPGNPEETDVWQTTLERTHKLAGELRTALAALTDEELDKEGLGEELARWMLHDPYHTGQIVLIRRLAGCWSTERS